jgi:putative ABC transport system substrate-binding protein
VTDDGVERLEQELRHLRSQLQRALEDKTLAEEMPSSNFAPPRGSRRSHSGPLSRAVCRSGGRGDQVLDRRTFIGSLALGALAAPCAAPAQPVRKVYRIGILALGVTSNMVGPQPRDPSNNALLRGLRDLGYVYGEHFVTEPRGAESMPERYPGLAAELVRLQVDVIVAPGPMLSALKQATSTIPIVMAAATDPVGDRLVRSLRQPGTNFTGLSNQVVELMGKRLELLKELVPGAAPVAVLLDPTSGRAWQVAEAAARERGWRLLSLEVRDPSELDSAFRAAMDARAGALLVMGGLAFAQARQIAELAIRSRIPAMYQLRPQVEAGGLISYGADIVEIWRRAAVFVDKILKGAKPANLPVEQPTRFELAINLTAAKAIGLTIPPSLLSRADHIIE